MLSLRCYWRDMPLMRVGLLFRRRTRVDSAVAAVEADMVSVVNYGFIVNIVNVIDVDVHHRAVVEEVSAIQRPPPKPTPK